MLADVSTNNTTLASEKFQIKNEHYTRGITMKRVTGGKAQLQGLKGIGNTKSNFEETS